MFNNYSLLSDYKTDFNPEKNSNEKAILIKQGFTNFQYQLDSEHSNINI